MRVYESWGRLKRSFEIIKSGNPNTMNKNAVHMLTSVRRTVSDSFIITTEDGKVIVIDGGRKEETGYFIAYLKSVTGQKRPRVDAWFLSHPHDDHCEVFLNAAESFADKVTFDKVYADFPEESAFFENEDRSAVNVLTRYYRLLPRFADKAVGLREGDVFNVGAAGFTVLYTFSSARKSGNDASVIMRMDLGGRSVMFTGDAGTEPGDYVVEKYGRSGLLHCDICKMAHHGQAGVDKNFYEAVAPEICLWPTPPWVWNNRGGGLKTPEVRGWIKELGVKGNYVAKDGSHTILL